MDWLSAVVTEYIKRYLFNSWVRKFAEGYSRIFLKTSARKATQPNPSEME